MDQETHESNRNCDNLLQGNGVTSENSRNSVNGMVMDDVAVTNSVEALNIDRGNRYSGSKIDDVGSNRELVGAPEVIINQDTCSSRLIAEKNSINSFDGEWMESITVRNSEHNTSFSEEKGHLELKIDEIGSSDEVVNAPDTCNQQRISERVGQTDSGNSCKLVDVVVLESVIVINSDQTACSRGENRSLEVEGNELGSSKTLVESVCRKVSKPEKESCVIDMKCSTGDEKGLRENPDGERVCRICHLGSEQLLETLSTTTVSSTAVNLIQLGCGCKDELGVAHSDCAEAWFKLKGNRLCEICGQPAKNITGVGDYRFMEEWNGRRFVGGSSSSERSGCWRGQPFCNFLMACLVIAFVLPWFFRVNMF